MADPIHQFQIVKVVDFPDVTLPGVGLVDLAITNSHIAMTIAFGLVVLFLTLVTSNAQVVPGRLQTVGETLFGMIDNLTETLERMKALRAKGLRVEYNDKNIEIVEQSLGTYRSELTEIRKARQTTKIADLQGMLGGAANEVFEAYRKAFAGQDRRTRDLDLLTTICDQLGEIGKQMASLGAFEPTDQNTKNLQIVTDQRVLFEREYTMIEEAKAQGIH